MVWGCMGWSRVGILAEVEGRMDAEQYVAILNDHLLPSMEESGIAKRISYSSKTMTQNIHQKEPGIGLKAMKSLLWTGQHSLLTSIPLNIFGNFSRQGLLPMKTPLQDCGNYGREWRWSGGIFLQRIIR